MKHKLVVVFCVNKDSPVATNDWFTPLQVVTDSKSYACALDATSS